LTGSSYFTQVAISGHQHREAPVADEGHDLPIGIGHLRGDRVGKPGSHGGEVAGQRVHLTAARWNVARPPGRNGPAVAAHDRSGVESPAQLVGQQLRLHRRVGARRALVRQLAPALHALLRRLQESALGLSRQQR